jgi:hypothetical protein
MRQHECKWVLYVVEESKTCFNCMTDEERKIDKSRVWDDFVSWHRKGREHDYHHDQ